MVTISCMHIQMFTSVVQLAFSHPILHLVTNIVTTTFHANVFRVSYDYIFSQMALELPGFEIS